MKKKYICPTVEIFNTDTEKLIASSNTIEKGDNSINDDNKDDYEILGRDDIPQSSNNIWDSSW